MRNSKRPIGIECLVFVAPLVAKEEPRDISHDEEWSELEMSLLLIGRRDNMEAWEGAAHTTPVAPSRPFSIKLI